MRKYFWLVLIVFILIVGVYYIVNSRKKTTTVSMATVSIVNQKFKVEIAKTDSEREKGLMNRKSLDANSGMLFIFPSSDIQSFWMKNTLIPLDIIYIDGNKITEMTTLNPPIDNNIPRYTPKNKANFVLELNANTAGKYNFQPGNQVEIKF